MARQYGKQHSSSVVPGLVHVWTTSVERTAYRMITRHYLGYWHALGRRIEARRYTAEVYNDIDARHAVCIVASTAAEMQARVHAHIERVIVAAQYDGYAREYVPDQLQEVTKLIAAEMPTELRS
jgi:hypothetical protein